MDKDRPGELKGRKEEHSTKESLELYCDLAVKKGQNPGTNYGVTIHRGDRTGRDGLNEKPCK